MNPTGHDDAPDLFSLLEIWRDLDFSEATSKDFGNRVPTLMKSSYRLPAAATKTTAEQQRSYPDQAVVPGIASNSELGTHPCSRLQA